MPSAHLGLVFILTPVFDEARPGTWMGDLWQDRRAILRRSQPAVPLILAGFLLNTIVERYWLGRWCELLFPVISFCLILTGIGIFISLLAVRARWFHFAIVTVCLLAVSVYATFSIGLRIIDSGVGAFGDCHGLHEAAQSTGEVPKSKIYSSQPAAYCQTEMVGIFMRRYDILQVYGVRTPTAQKQFVLRLAEYKRAANTKPIRVAFYDSENWTEWHASNGVSGGRRGPEKLLRVATIP